MLGVFGQSEMCVHTFLWRKIREKSERKQKYMRAMVSLVFELSHSHLLADVSQPSGVFNECLCVSVSEMRSSSPNIFCY